MFLSVCLINFYFYFTLRNHLASSKLDSSYSLINVKDWDNVQSSLDTRKCYLCQLNGDHNKCGRLISFDLNWIHLNCLLWSQDITTNDHIIEQIQLLTTKLKNSVSFSPTHVNVKF
jgi:hypothetical protein